MDANGNLYTIGQPAGYVVGQQKPANMNVLLLIALGCFLAMNH